MPPLTKSQSHHCTQAHDTDHLPRVVIDLERLRHINCGLGRFSLELGLEILKSAQGRVQPLLFAPKTAARYFAGQTFERIDVAPWKKEAVLRMVRPLVQPLLPKSKVSLWHVTHQTSRYLPLDARVPIVLTIHDLNFLHTAPHDDQ